MADISNYDGNTLISGTSYEDSIGNYANNVTVYAYGGNDKIVNRGSNVLINGGIDDDAIDLDPYYQGSVENVTLTGGTGNDTFVVDPYNSNTISAVITDFTSDDVFVYDADFDGTKELSYTIEDGNIVLRNNISSDGSEISPTFVVTLKGVSSLSQISSAKYYRVKYWDTKYLSGTNPESYTFGTLFVGKTIHNTVPNTVLNGSDLADSIYSDADNVTISSGDGDDTLNVAGSNSSITVGNGNNSIHFYANAYNPTVRTGKDSDSVDSGAQGALINTGAGNDSVHLYSNATNHTVFLFEGNDSIDSGGQTVVIYAGEGNDSIHLYANATNNSVFASDGNDSIDSGAKTAFINMNAGNDYVYLYNNATNHTVNAAEGADTLHICGPDHSINGGAGNDYIQMYNHSLATGNTVSTGTGDDTIRSYNQNGVLYQYNSGDGADIFYGFTDKDTLQITGEKYSSLKSVNDLILTVGNGKISLVGAASLSSVNIKGTIDGGDSNLITLTAGNDNYTNTVSGATISALGGNDSIYNGVASVSIAGGTGNDFISISSGKYQTVIAGDGSDTIYNGNADYSKIYGGDGNDSIWNYGLYQTLDAGTGDDTIYAYSYNDSINGGAGADRISISSSSNGDNTIVGGTGNDSIYFGSSSDKNRIIYNSGDGNDYIDGFNSTSTLQIGNGTGTYSSETSGKNIIVTVGSGKITLVGASSLSAVNIDGTKIDDNSWTLSGSTAKYGTSSKTLVTVKGVKSTSGLSLSGNVVTVSKASLDAKKVTISDSYTLALDDDVDKPSTKNASWSLKSSTATYTTAYKTAGYTLASNGKSITYSKETSAETLATVKGAKSTSGLSVKNNVVTLKNSALASKVTVSGDYEFNFASDYKKATITGSKNDDTITARGSNVVINGGTGDDTIKILGKSTTVKGGGGKDVFYYQSNGANVINDYSEEDTINFASGTAKVTTSGSDVVFTVGKGKITVKDAADKVISYVDDTGNQTYPNDEGGVKLNGKIITLTENYFESSFNLADYDKVFQTIDASAVQRDLNITGNDLKNKITGSSDDDTINGGGAADTILGANGNDSINGGKGNDSIIGGKDNDTLTGGAGADIFVYSKGDGNDIITDYAEEDKISITSDTVNKITPSKNNLVFTLTSKGKITITGGNDGKTITYIDSDGEHTYPEEESVQFNKKGTSAVLTSAYSDDTFNISDYDKYKNSVVTIDSSAVNHELKIIANKLANKVVGTGQDDYIDGGSGADTINGGKGNDSLEGGKGNDALTGSKGSDVFIYNDGDGNDVIADFTNEDKIIVTSGNISKVSAKNSDVIFKIGKGKITVKNAADKSFPIYDTSDNILTNYAPASNFVEDDEAVLTVNNNSLSSIVEDKSYAAIGSTDTTLNLTTEKSFIPVITQSSKK